jgi:hypothetical protein
VLKYGKVNQHMLRHYRRAPSVQAVMAQFGSLNAAYREIGYAPNLNPEREQNRDIEHRAEARVARVTGDVLTERGHRTTYEKHSLTLCIDSSLTFQIVARGPWMVDGKTPYWSARWPDEFNIDFLVYCRMPRGSPQFHDFFVIPAGCIEPGKFATLVGPNAADFSLLRHSDLRLLLDLAENVDLTQVGRFLERV